MGFGAREFIEFLFVPAIGLGLLFKRANTVLMQILLVFILSFGIYINQVQARQYRDHIILWDGMDKQDYWRVFLQTSPGYFYWLEERNGFQKPALINTKIDHSYLNDFEHPEGWENDMRVSEKVAHTGKFANFIDGDFPKSATFSHLLTADEIKNDSLIQTSAWFYGPQPDFTALIISFENNGLIITKNDVRIRKFADQNFNWNRAILQTNIPANLATGSTLRVYIDNTYNSEKFYIDDFRVDLVKK